MQARSWADDASFDIDRHLVDIPQRLGAVERRRHQVADDLLKCFLGISVSIFSYRGEVTIGLMVDAALVPDPGEIIDALEPELAELRELEPASHGGTSRRPRVAAQPAA